MEHIVPAAAAGVAVSPPISTVVANPLVLMYLDSAAPGVICRINRPNGISHQHFGVLVCDLVRHVANAFDVEEDAVWDWVERERVYPTASIKPA